MDYKRQKAMIKLLKEESIKNKWSKHKYKSKRGQLIASFNNK